MNQTLATTKKQSVIPQVIGPRSAHNPEPIVIESSAGITLRCGEATLRLLPSGELQLNGQTVTIEANQIMEIKATQVRVNCEE